MAEIKSTLEKVMERAARMAGSEGETDLAGEEKVKDGMRAAAAWMRGEEIDLNKELASCPASARPYFMKGVARALLRNIILPRGDEQLQSGELAMNGLVQVGQGNSDLLAIFGDIKKILDQYGQHRKQIREQLEENFSRMMPQLEAAMAQQTGMAMKLKPSQHPKFQEEWQKVLDDLNGQYGRAVDQHKQLVSQILASMV